MSATMTMTLEQMIGRDRLIRSEKNPRKHFAAEELQELGDSLKMHGFLNALWVRPLAGPPDKPLEPQRYEIVCGERRWRAAGVVGIKELPCKVVPLSATDKQVMEWQYVENLQRADLQPIEEAEGFAQLIKTGDYTAESLAVRLGKSRSHVFGRLNLLKQPVAVKEAVANGKLSAHLATAVAKLPHAQREEAIEGLEGLSVQKGKEFLAARFKKDGDAVERVPTGLGSEPKRNITEGREREDQKEERVRVTQTVSMPASTAAAAAVERKTKAKVVKRDQDGPSLEYQRKTIERAETVLKEMTTLIAQLDQLIGMAAPEAREAAEERFEGLRGSFASPEPKPKPVLTRVQRERIAEATRKRWAAGKQDGRAGSARTARAL